MASRAGLSGVAVGMAAVGAFLVYAGVKDVPLLDGARSLLRGETPEGNPPKVTTIGITAEPGTGTGAAAGGSGTSAASASAPAGTLNGAIVTEARKHLGKPYRWGAAGPNAFDCSGLCVYVLRRCGVDLPRLPTQGFLVWGGAKTITRAEMTPGDLVVWSGHMGIAVSATEMIHAPHTGDVVRVGAIDSAVRGKPSIRRVKGRTVSV